MPSARSRAELDARVTSDQLSDSLDALGVRGQVMTGDIGALQRPARIAGPARTIRFEPITTSVEAAYRTADPYRPFIEFMDGVQPGEVIVVSTGGDRRTAYWGELFSAAALGRGAVGVVCDSYTRDRPKVEALGFPVFSAGTRPLDYRARMQIVAAQLPVRCGDVDVAPGDLVLADTDGIVVVPDGVHEPAVSRANQRAGTESSVLDQLLAGRSIGEVWTTYGVL